MAKLPQILVATTNAGKQREVAAFLDGLVEVVLTDSIPQLAGFDIEETGQTYQENALLKAISFSKKAGLPALADDSGLEITALDGQPGLHSRRFYPGSDEDRNNRILELLKDANDRSAQFVCVMAFVDAAANIQKIFRGVAKGRISDIIQSGDGFAYDDIFIPDGFDQTYSQLGREIKSQISHRTKALQQVRTYLQDAVKHG